MSLLLWGFKFFSSSTLFFNSVSAHRFLRYFLGLALGFHVCKNLKKDFFGPMCSCMPIDHRSGINGRDDCLWLKINHLSHSSDKKWKAPWTIFRCAALLAQIQKKWWQLWLPTTSFENYRIWICWTNFGYAVAKQRFFLENRKLMNCRNLVPNLEERSHFKLSRVWAQF